MMSFQPVKRFGIRSRKLTNLSTRARIYPSGTLSSGSTLTRRALLSGSSCKGAPHGHGLDNDVEYTEALAKGEAYTVENGYDLESLVEQQVAWGDCDSFQHVNNVMYIRYYETGRIQFMAKIARELSTPDPRTAYDSLMRGKPGGIGVILGDMYSRYRRPVTFPDTLLIAHRIKSIEKARFKLEHLCWSFQQKTVVNTGECSMVCYDYGSLKKMNMTQEFETALKKRMIPA